MFSLQTRNRAQREVFVPGKAPWGPAWFQSLFSLILANPEGSRARKGIKFWIERLTINSAGELGFGEGGLVLGELSFTSYVSVLHSHDSVI